MLTLVNCVGLIGVDSKVVYRRYASLFFVCGIGSADNELVTLEIIHRYVEVLDRYFGNVSVFWVSLDVLTRPGVRTGFVSRRPRCMCRVLTRAGSSTSKKRMRSSTN